MFGCLRLCGQVVTQGGYKQHVPIRCTLCTSRSQPHGKVVDAVSMHPKDVRKFLGQHLQTDCHNRALGALAAKNAAQDGEQTLEEVPCEAVILKFDLEAEGAATWKRREQPPNYMLWSIMCNSG